MKKDRKRALYIGGGIALALLGIWWLSKRNTTVTPQTLPQLPPPPPPSLPAGGISGLQQEPEGGIDIDGLTLDGEL